MPKLKQTASQTLHKQIGDNIRCLVIRRGLKDERIYKSAPFSRSTWYARLQQPGTLTVDELDFVAKRLGVSLLDLLDGIK